ncbi:hypothetical protein PTKIN_Ptkin05aG0114400 [Pterospermum kingtungense]
MKSAQFLVNSIFLLNALFSLSRATSTHTYDSFLHCLSLYSEDSSSIAKVIYTQNNSSYPSVLEFSMQNLRFSTATTPKPWLIITRFDASQIQATIYCSREHGLQIRTRSGGHDLEGLSYVSEVPCVIIDLINFRSVDVDEENRVAWVQSGATLGIGGYFSGGGYGLLFRNYGLAGDNIIDAQFIDVNGRILDRKATGEDLFWAIRGGGGATVTTFKVTKTLEQNAIKLIHRWQFVAHNLPDETFFMVDLIASVNSSQEGKRTGLASFSLFFLGDVDELVPLIQERFPELGLVKEDCTEMSWIESILFFGGIQNKSLDVLFDKLSKQNLIM